MTLGHFQPHESLSRGRGEEKQTEEKNPFLSPNLHSFFLIWEGDYNSDLSMLLTLLFYFSNCTGCQRMNQTLCQEKSASLDP